MDTEIIETIIAIVAFFVLRHVTINAIRNTRIKYNYSKYRVKPILKFTNFIIFVFFLLGLIAIWGVEQTKLWAFLTSILTIVGIALFAQWSILSNITSSLIIFMSHPVKWGESIAIMDKDFDISGKVSDIGLFYVILKTDTNVKIMIPNNVFLQKASKIKGLMKS